MIIGPPKKSFVEFNMFILGSPEWCAVTMLLCILDTEVPLETRDDRPLHRRPCPGLPSNRNAVVIITNPLLLARPNTELWQLQWYLLMFTGNNLLPTSEMILSSLIILVNLMLHVLTPRMV